MTENPKNYASPELLITPRGLKQRLPVEGSQAEPMTVLDLRPTEAYVAGHIPGAVHLDLFGVSLVDTAPAPLEAFLWMIGHLLVSRGVSEDTGVVVYDEHSGIRAARAFWFLEFFGHQDARFLDGGYRAWTEAGLATTTEASAPTAGRWTLGREDALLATRRDVSDRLGRSDVIMLDTRSSDEYYGTKVRAKRGGAIPGAVHIEWSDNLAPDGTFKTAADLVELYEARGVTADKEVVAYCQGGYRAALSYVSLRLLGYPRVRNYIGSWKEWGDGLDLPIEVPRASASLDSRK